jgi:hypothetical protein
VGRRLDGKHWQAAAPGGQAAARGAERQAYGRQDGGWGPASHGEEERRRRVGCPRQLYVAVPSCRLLMPSRPLQARGTGIQRSSTASTAFSSRATPARVRPAVCLSAKRGIQRSLNRLQCKGRFQCASEAAFPGVYPQGRKIDKMIDLVNMDRINSFC